MNGRANMEPKDTPVSSMENIHSRILPNRLARGSHMGTDSVDGIM